MVRQRITLISLYLMAISVVPGCAWISLGDATTANDTLPAGDVVAQGAFASANTGVHANKEVSGFARIYRDTTSGVHVVRLESLETPDELGTLEVVAEAGGSTVLRTALKATRGNQNYLTSVGINDARSWSTVRIRSTTWPDPATADYGVALLTNAN